MPNKTAKLIKYLEVAQATGVRGLYKLSHPLSIEFSFDGIADGEVRDFDHVVVSCVTVNGRPETAVFGSDENGNTQFGFSFDMEEAEGLSMSQALFNLGYQ
jgi:hypothetical protein